MRHRQHQFSIILMSASLMLLAAFLFLFLKKEWEDELGSLKKETGFIFVNSIRNIEGNMIDRLISHNIWSSPSESPPVIRFPEPLAADTTRIISLTGEKQLQMIRMDTQFQIRIAALPTPKGETEIAGSLSMIVAVSDKDIREDTVLATEKTEMIWALLDSNFSASMKNADLPVGFRLVNLHTDTICPEEGVRTGSYTDLASGDSYIAELSDYHGYLLKKLAPEILFSLGLFGCVSLAFFMVFKNLQAQRRLTALKNEFIQNVTHELKTPIATVGVALEALRNFDALEDQARTREYLDISSHELNRLNLLVDKILRMSLFEKNEPVLHNETVDFRSIVSDVLDSMKLQFEKYQATAQFRQTGETFFLTGDRLHLSSVVYNLLDNALKYSKQNPAIDVNLQADGRELRLEVADRGIGIDPAHQEKIFEKFYRVPAGSVHNVKGHGLGLSYIAEVVKKHRGKIEVEAREGGGTVFRLAFPLQNIE